VNAALPKFRAGELNGTSFLLIANTGHPERSEGPNIRRLEQTN
jgi:hypothetical protein